MPPPRARRSDRAVPGLPGARGRGGSLLGTACAFALQVDHAATPAPPRARGDGEHEARGHDEVQAMLGVECSPAEPTAVLDLPRALA